MESLDGANGGLDAAVLYARCDPAKFGFETTAELEGLGDVVGQSRAMDAVRFGVEVEREGYNVFALGPPGTGKRTLVRRFVEERAAGEPPPPEWAYVNNFERPNRPRLLRLPANTGAALRKDMKGLAERLRPALSVAFESEEYQARRQTIEEEYRERSEHAFEELRNKAVAAGLALVRTPLGWAFAPVDDGRVLPPEEVARLPEDERRRLESEVGRLERELQEVLGRMPRWERERSGRLGELNREIAQFAVGHLIGDLRDRYSEVAEVVEHLEAVRQDIVRSVGEIVGTQPGAATGPEVPPSGPVGAQGMRRYWVNALTNGVPHDGEFGGAPVVYEDNPTYQNLIGRVEYVSQMGALVTDFNGGADSRGQQGTRGDKAGPDEQRLGRRGQLPRPGRPIRAGTYQRTLRGLLLAQGPLPVILEHRIGRFIHNQPTPAILVGRTSPSGFRATKPR